MKSRIGEKAQLKNLIVILLLLLIIGFTATAFNIPANKSISIDLEYRKGAGFDADNDGIEYIKGAIDFTVENTSFSWDVNQTKLGTRWVINSLDNIQTTTLCYGASKTCRFIDLEPSSESWDDAMYISYGRHGAGYNNTVGAQVIYVDYSLGEDPHSDIAYSGLSYLPAVFMETKETKTYTRIISFLEEKLEVIRGTLLSIKARLVYLNDSPVPSGEVSLYLNNTLVGTEMTDIFGHVTFELNTSLYIPSEYLLNITYHGQITKAPQETITVMPSFNLTALKILPLDKTNTTSNLTNTTGNATGIEESLTQLPAEIGKPVRWVKRIRVRKNSSEHMNIPFKLPEEAEKIVIEKDDSIERRVIQKKEMTAFGTNSASDKKAPFFELKGIKNKKKFIEIEDSSGQDEVEYSIGFQTPPPRAMEKNISRYKKVITVSAPHLNYTYVLTYTSITEIVKTENKKAIKLYWLRDINSSVIRESRLFTANDTNENGYIDYIEWVTPHLSNQTFEVVIEIAKALHLDENKTPISDIYEKVKSQDNIWSEPIYHNEYVRVTFEKELNSYNDITVYVRNSQNMNTSIEVYRYNSTEKITEFPIITSEKYYKVYLLNMSTSSKTFELKVKNHGDDETAYLEFDHIIDPEGSKSITASKDSYINQYVNTENNGARLGLRVGKAGTATRRLRTLIEFNLSSIPGDAVITNAVLSLYYSEDIDASGNRIHGVHRVLESWEEGSGLGDTNDANINGTTWDERWYSQNWASAGGSFNSTATDTQTVGDSESYGWIEWNVTSDVQYFLGNPGSNFGWLIKDTDEATLSTRKYYNSTEDPDASSWPKLEVNYTYTINDSEAPSWSGQFQGDHGLGQIVNLTAMWSDDAALDSFWLSTNETGAWQNYTAREFGHTLSHMIDVGSFSTAKNNPLAAISISSANDAYVRQGINISYTYGDNAGNDKVSIIRFFSPIDITGYDKVVYFVDPDIANFHATDIHFRNGTGLCSSPLINLTSAGWQRVEFDISGITGDCNKSRIDSVRISFNDINDADTGSGNIVVDEAYLRNISGFISFASETGWYNISSAGVGTSVAWRIYANDSSGNINSTAIMNFVIEDTINPSVESLQDNPDPVNIYSFINISAVVTDNTAVDTVLIEVEEPDSSKTNYTTKNSQDTYFNASINTTQMGYHTYRIYANDSYGNMNSSQTGTFTVKNQDMYNVEYMAESDSYASEESADMNYGSSEELVSGENESKITEILVKFSVDIPEEANITNANLSLYFYNSTISPSDALNLSARRVTGSWDELSVTWNSKPGYVSSSSDEANLTEAYGWVGWNVTGIVRLWVNGSAADWGFAIVPGNKSANASKHFRSKEYSNQSLRPVLEVDYSYHHDLSWSGQSQSIATAGQIVNLTAMWSDDSALDSFWLSTNETGTWQNYTAREFGHTLSHMIDVDSFSKAKNNDLASIDLYPANEAYVRQGMNISYVYGNETGNDKVSIIRFFSPIDITGYGRVVYFVKPDTADFHATDIHLRNGSGLCSSPNFNLTSAGWQKIEFNISDITGTCNKSEIDSVRIGFNDINNSDTGSGSILVDEAYLRNSTGFSSFESAISWYNISSAGIGTSVAWRIYANDSSGKTRHTNAMVFTLAEGPKEYVRNLPISIYGEDTHSDPEDEIANYKESETLDLIHSPDGSGMIYIEFSDVNFSRLFNASTVETAQLMLRFTDSTNANAVNISLYRINSSWNASNITYGDYGKNPTIIPAPVDVVMNLTDNYGIKTWNISSLVKGWANRSYDNYGVALNISGAEGYTTKKFRSTEYVVSIGKVRRPKLHIVYYDFENPSVNISIKDALNDNISSVIEFLDPGGSMVLTVEDDPEPTTIPADVYDIRITTEDNVVESILFKDVNISEDIPRIVHIDDPSDNQGYEELYAIDPAGLNFTSANVTIKNATASSLYKCADWNFTTRACMGTWKKLMDITPGRPYSFNITAQDPGFAETGVSSINSNKSTYHINETAKIIMVILDTEGYLAYNASLTLNITSPDSIITKYSTGSGEITETEVGIYESVYNKTSLEGNYSMLVKAVGDGVNSTLLSEFLVKEYYEFDILRHTPVTIDPWREVVNSSIKLISYTSSTEFNFSEVLPVNFTVLYRGNATETISGDKIILKWSNLSNNSVINYIALPPFITPDLYELGPAYVDYASSRYYEARPWYLAIDPLEGGGSKEQICYDDAHQVVPCPQGGAFTPLASDCSYDGCPYHYMSATGCSDNYIEFHFGDIGIPGNGTVMNASVTLEYSDESGKAFDNDVYCYNGTGFIKIADAVNHTGSDGTETYNLSNPSCYNTLARANDIRIRFCRASGDSGRVYIDRAFVNASYVEGTGWRSPSATGDDYSLWLDPENAYESDGLNTIENAAGEAQDWYDFSFNVPAGVTIDGIEVKVKAKVPTPDNSSAGIELSWDGGAGYTSSGYSLGTDSTSYVILSSGGSSNTWGRSWSGSEFSDDSFRLRLNKTGPSISLLIDHIQAKAYFSDNLPPYINMSINNTSPQRYDVVNITADISDNIELVSCLFRMNGTSDGSFVNISKELSGTSSQCSQNFTIDAAKGSYINFTVIVNDTSSNTNQSSLFITVQNSPPPTATILYPAPNMYTSKQPLDLNITYPAEDDGDSITIYWYVNGILNQTTPANTTLNASDGYYILNASLYDGYNFSSNSSVNFTLDTTPPNITLYLDKTNNQLIYETIVNITANLSDRFGLSLGQIIVNDTGSERVFNFSISGASAQISQNITISCPEGCVINFSARAYDLANNSRTNSTLKTVVKDRPVHAVNISKNDSGIYQHEHVLFNATWNSSSSLHYYIFSTNQSGGWLNTTPRLFTGDNVSSNISIITAEPGTVVGWQFYANNTVGNSSNTSLQAFTVGGVIWNQSNLNLGSTQKERPALTKNARLIGYLNNSNARVSCYEGACSIITSNFTSQDINDTSTNVKFSCSSSEAGIHNAMFSVNSTEDVYNHNISVTCSISSLCAPLCPTNTVGESGNTTLSASTTQLDVDLSRQYDLSKAFLIARHHAAAASTTSDTPPEEHRATIRFLDNDTVRIERYDHNSRPSRATWSILQSDNIDVIPFYNLWSDDDIDDDVAISPALPADYQTRCFVENMRNTRIQSADIDCMAAGDVMSNITSTTALNLKRYSSVEISGCSGLDSGETRGFIVCFNDNTTVQAGSFSASIQCRTETLAKPVNTSSSWVLFSFRADDDGLTQTSLSANLTSETEVEFCQDSTTSNPATISVQFYVVSFDNSTGSLVERQGGSVADVILQQDWDFSGNYDHNETLAVCYEGYIGDAGNNYPRNWWTAHWLDANTIRQDRGRAGGPGDSTDASCQAVQWPSILSYETGSDALNPIITVGSNNTAPIFNETINITANVSDETGLSRCVFIANHTGSDITKTVGGVSGQCSQNFTINLTRGAVINFTVIVNDTSSNKNQSSLLITVANTPPTAPVLTIPSGNISGDEITLTWLNGTDADNDPLTHTIYISGSGDFSTINQSSVEDDQNYTTTGLTNGVWYWKVNVTDSESGAESETRNFTIDETPPDITLITPLNESFDDDGMISYTFNVSDLYSVANCSLYYIDSGISILIAVNTSVNESVTQEFIKTIDDDDVIDWFVNCSDILGLVGSSGTLRVTVDMTDPSVELDFPGNNSFDSDGAIEMEYTPTDTYLDACRLYTNLSGVWAVNQTEDDPDSGSLNIFNSISNADGSYIWNVLCNDSAGNIDWGDSNFTINIDTKNPGINLTSPTPPNNTNQTTIRSMTVNATHFDVNPEIIALYLNGIQNQSKYWTGHYTNFTLSSIPDGSHTYYVFIRDDAGNFNATETRTVNIDLTPPVIYPESPDNNSYLNSSNITLRYNSSDAFPIKNCSLIINGAINQTNASITRDISQNFTLNNLNNTYSWQVNCTDIYGHTNKSETRVLNIDLNTPLISNESVNDTSVSVQDFVCLNVTVTDNFIVDTVLAEIDVSPPGSDEVVELLDDGLGCDKAASDNVYSREYQNMYVWGTKSAYYWNRTVANDSAGNIKITTPNLKWNVSAAALLVAAVGPVNYVVNETPPSNNVTLYYNISCAAPGPPCEDITAFVQYHKDGVWSFITTETTDLIGEKDNETVTPNPLPAGSSFISNFTITAGENTGNNTWLIRCLGLGSNTGFNIISENSTIRINDRPVAALHYPTNGSWMGSSVILNASDSADSDGNLTNYIFELDNNSGFESPSILCDIDNTVDTALAYDGNLTGSYTHHKGNYTNATSDDSSYWVVGLDGYGTSDAYMVLEFNISDYYISNESLKNMSFPTRYCHSGDDLSIVGCNGDDADGSAQGSQDVELYNYSSGLWVDIGNLSTADGGYEVESIFSINAYLPHFINHTGKNVKIRYEMDYYNNLVTKDSFLVLDYAGVNITYDSEKDYCLFDTALQGQCTEENFNCYLRLNVTDTEGLKNSTFITIGIDNTGPTVVLGLPSNRTNISSASYTMNATLTDAGSGPDTAYFFYRQDSGSEWQSACPEDGSSPYECIWDTSSLQDGNGYAVRVYGTDTVGNTGYNDTHYNITLDRSGPVISLESPANATWSIKNITFRYNVTDAHSTVLNCSMVINSTVNSTNTTITEEKSLNFSINNFPDSHHSWYVSCTDYLGNSNSSETRIIKTDSTPPTAVLNRPQTMENISASAFRVNATVTDSGIGVNKTVFEYRSSDTGSWTRICSSSIGLDDHYNCTWNTGILEEGSGYQVRVYANDSLRHTSNLDNATNITIDRTPPAIYLEGPANNTQDVDGDNLLFEYNVTDTLLDVVNCSLITNGKINQTNSTITQRTAQNFSLSGMPDGSYLWNISCTDSAGNKNVSETRILVIAADTGTPSITLVSPENNSIYTKKDINFRFNVSDALSGIANCSVIINNKTNTTNSSLISESSTNTITVNNVPDGNYTWSVNCTDTSPNRNIGASTTYNLTVRETTTIIVNVTGDKPSYEKGETAAITTTTKDSFGSFINTSITTDIIRGNASMHWWDTAWKSRKQIFINETSGSNRTDALVRVNVTGLGGYIKNCVNETRVIYNDSTKLIPVTVNVLDGDNSTYCDIVFEANVTGGVSNQGSYYLYYNNSDADNPGYDFLSEEVTILYEDFEDDWETTTGTSCDPTPDCNLKGNFSDCDSNGGDYRFCARDDPRFGSWAFCMEDWDTPNNNMGIWHTFSGLDSCGDTCYEINVSFWFTAYSLDAGEYCEVIADDDSQSAVQLYRCSDGDADCDLEADMPLSGQYIYKNVSLVEKGIGITGSNIEIRLMAQHSATGDECFFDDFSITGYRRSSQNISTRIGNTEEHIERFLNQTGVDGIWVLSYGTNISYGNYSAVSIAYHPDYLNSTGDAQFEITADTTPPSIALDTANRTWEKQDITLYYTPDDTASAIVNCTLILNNKRNITNKTITKGILNNFTLYSLPQGAYTWTVNCTDDDGNIGTNTSHRTFYIDNTMPSIGLNLPVHLENFSVSFVRFNFTAEDNMDTNLTCSLKIDKKVNVSGIEAANGSYTNITVHGFSDGMHRWNITCWDNASNINTSLSRNFTTDTTHPVIALNYPANNSWDNDGSIQMNYTPSDTSLRYCELWGNFSGTWQKNQTDTTPTSYVMNNFSPITLNEGSYVWNVNCSDYAGNYNWSIANYTLNVDSTYPKINLTSPTPINNSNQTLTSLTINATHNETNPSNIVLFWNNTKNQTKSYHGSYTNFSLSSLADSEYTYYIWINDSAGNYNQTETRTIRIDTTPPVVRLKAPGNKTWRNNDTKTVLFEYNASDALLAIANCSLIINSRINQTNRTVKKRATQNFTQAFPEGNYNWSINCSDSLNNLNSSETRLVKVDLGFPSISKESINTTEEMFTYFVCLNASIQDSVSGSNSTWAEIRLPDGSYENVSLYDNSVTSCDTSNGNGVYSYKYQLGNIGQYNWTRTFANDSAGNINYTITGILFNSTSIASMTVNMTSPQYSLKINESGAHNSFIMDCLVGCDDTPEDCDAVNLYAVYSKSEGTDILTTTEELVNNQSSHSCGNMAANATCSALFNVSAGPSYGNTNWTVWCRADSENAGQPESEEQVNISINDHPVAGFTYPLNGTWLHSTEILNASSSYDLDSAITYYEFYLDNNTAFTSPSLLCSTEDSNCTFKTLTQSQCRNNTMSCYLMVNVKENDGLKNSTYITIGIDNTGPASALDQPLNGTNISSGSYVLNATVSDSGSGVNTAIFLYRQNPSSSWQAACTDKDGSDSYNCTWDTDSLADGNHYQVRVYANDSEGNIGYNNTHYNITLDRSPPSIYLKSPSNNTWGTENITFYYNVTDTHSIISNCSIVINGTVNITNKTITEGQTLSLNVNNFADGHHSWHVNCTDFLGNTNSSQIRVIKTDRTGPSAVLNLPITMENISASAFRLNATVTDSGIGVNKTVFEYRSSDAGSWIKICSNSLGLDDNYNCTWNTGILEEGNDYQVRVYANDTLNNTGSYDNATNITIDRSPPAIYLEAPANNSQDVDGIVVFYYNATDALLSIKNCSLYINGTINKTNTTITESAEQEFRVSGINDGFYNWSVGCYDSADNFNRTAVFLLAIAPDTDPPNITLIGPQNNTIYTSPDISFRFDVDDALSGIANCTVIINNRTNTTNSSIISETGTNTITVNDVGNGNYTWSVNCTDTSPNRNIGASTTYNLTVRETTTIIVNLTTDKAAYEMGEPAAITTITKDEFKTLINTSITTDIIRSNTSLEWWNSSWQFRKPVYLTNSLNENRTNISVQVNITGLDTNIESCADEIRIIRNNSLNHTIMQSQVISGDDSTWCEVRFYADIGPGAVNESNYYAYYSNSDANDPGFGPVASPDRPRLIFFDDFETQDYSAGPYDDWGTFQGQAADPNPAVTTDADLDPNGDYGSKLCGGDGGAVQGTWVNRTVNTLGYKNINVSFQRSVGLPAGQPPFESYYRAQYDAEGVSFRDMENLTASVSLGWKNFTLPSTADNNSNLVIRFFQEESRSDECSWTDDVRVEGIITGFNSSVGEEEELVQRTKNSTGFDGEWQFSFDTNVGTGNYSAISVAQDPNYNSAKDTAYFSVIPDTTSPTVALNTANNTWERQNITLYYTPDDTASAIVNCTLILNDKKNMTNKTITKGIPNNFTLYNLAEGAYTWTVNCTDDDGNIGTNTSHRTFYIDNTMPSIGLNLP
ncbi:DNRLRE domain-containing protein, partial [Candidatus Woesearchaeota archaeon]|nr:DNRLRE domain-containing protein [Candidatus Woesearchaeota archaeon]